MAEKTNSEAKQVFRQFAWNLAGTLAGAKKTAGGAGKKRPAKVETKRP